jgi:hypothetical protein
MAVNKMFIMLPVMFLARKLDGEDPKIVFLLRLAYGVVQTICALIVLFTYYKATQVKSMQLIYVPPPAMVRIYKHRLEFSYCAMGEYTFDGYETESRGGEPSRLQMCLGCCHLIACKTLIHQSLVLIHNPPFILHF